jgi:hypothetical protein
VEDTVGRVGGAVLAGDGGGLLLAGTGGGTPQAVDRQVAEGAPVKPLLQVAVQTRPEEEDVPQLKMPLAGLVGLPAQVVGVTPPPAGLISMSAQFLTAAQGRAGAGGVRQASCTASGYPGLHAKCEVH